jgi:hypothetical protein
MQHLRTFLSSVDALKSRSPPAGAGLRTLNLVKVAETDGRNGKQPENRSFEGATGMPVAPYPGMAVEGQIPWCIYVSNTTSNR